jgi:hypothetical protein
MGGGGSRGGDTERNVSTESTPLGGGIEMDHACIPFLSKVNKSLLSMLNMFTNFRKSHKCSQLVRCSQITANDL